MVKIRTTIIISIVAMVLGFLLGRITFTPETVVDVKETVKYIPSTNIIRDTISKDRLVPYETFVNDTIVKYLTQPVDTAAILRDYYLSRKYALDFSNDTIGIFKVDAEVNQNRLVSANSFIQPITKFIYKESTITEQTVRTFQPWVMIGTDVNLDCQQITFGFDLKQKYILGVSGLRVNNKYNYTFNIGLKF